MRLLGPLFAVLIIAGCGSPAVLVPAASGNTVGAFDCNVTKPRAVAPPTLPATRADQNEAFVATGTPLFVHSNDALAVRLPLDGRFQISGGDDGVKLGWIRLKDGALTATAKRLDVPGPVRVDLADNYGLSGLQVTGIRFREPGCYEVTGAVAGNAPLTFVARVVRR